MNVGICSTSKLTASTRMSFLQTLFMSNSKSPVKKNLRMKNDCLARKS